MSCLLYQVELKLQKDAPNFEKIRQNKESSLFFQEQNRNREQYRTSLRVFNSIAREWAQRTTEMSILTRAIFHAVLILIWTKSCLPKQTTEKRMEYLIFSGFFAFFTAFRHNKCQNVNSMCHIFRWWNMTYLCENQFIKKLTSVLLKGH